MRRLLHSNLQLRFERIRERRRVAWDRWDMLNSPCAWRWVVAWDAAYHETRLRATRLGYHVG